MRSKKERSGTEEERKDEGRGDKETWSCEGRAKEN